jgi:hypothetical protein
MSTEFRGAPGVYTGNTLRARNIFTNTSPAQVQFLPSFVFIDGSLSRDTGSTPTNVLRAGTMLGKITTGGLYRPSVIGLTTAAATSGATTLTVTAVCATEMARLIAAAGGNVNVRLIGPPTAAGTVAVLAAVACSAASGTSLTVAAIGAALAAGSYVAPADGSHVPVNVLPNAYGVDVLDTAGSAVNQPLDQLLRGADFIASKIPNLVADDSSTTTDTSVQAWAKARLKEAGYFTFDNDR